MQLKNIQARRRGQALSEYLILTALIAVASIAVVQILGGNIRSRLAMISDAIGGANPHEIKAIEAREKHYQVRDLGDFSDAIQDNQSN